MLDLYKGLWLHNHMQMNIITHTSHTEKCSIVRNQAVFGIWKIRFQMPKAV